MTSITMPEMPEKHAGTSSSASTFTAPVPAVAAAAGANMAANDVPPKIRLNIAILLLGSRGDLQPALEIATILQRHHGHRVRLATHPIYREAIEAAGVGFFSTGDKLDVKEMQRRRLLSWDEMKPLVPTIQAEFDEMARSWWAACIGAQSGTGEGEDQEDDFVADALIATMQCFDHTSIAARLSIPLHMLATNVRTPTKYLPHSQAEKSARETGKFKNRFSFWMFDYFFLHNMKDIFNNIRVNLMGLEPCSPAWQLSQFNRMHVPFSCIWSPSFLPRPADWGSHIDVVGYIFHDEPDYDPPATLVDFLNAEPERPPIYIGFGSMSFHDPERFFREVFGALAKTGVRAVVAKGWSDLGDELTGELTNVYVVEDVPHDWLFPRVRAVICHGGGGTTAMALRSGKPTLVVPVAGDQAFWGYRVSLAGCGPEPLSIKLMTVDLLAEKIEDLLQPKYVTPAAELGARIAAEPPGQNGFVASVLQTVSVYENKQGRCDVLPDRPAVWSLATKGSRRLSAMAAYILVQAGKLRREDLRPVNVVKWPDLVSPGDPVTGVVITVQNLIADLKRHSTVLPNGLLLAFHILRAPFILLLSLLFGLYNFLDYLAYELGSPFEPKLYAANPRLYSLGEMLAFLFLTPFVELGSIVTQPPRLALTAQRGAARAVAEVPLAVLRVVVALVNLPVGLVALTVRRLDLAVLRAMGERPNEDVVVLARWRQGRLETEKLAAEEVEQGVSVRMGEEVVRRWEEGGQAKRG